MPSVSAAMWGEVHLAVERGRLVAEQRRDGRLHGPRGIKARVVGRPDLREDGLGPRTGRGAPRPSTRVSRSTSSDRQAFEGSVTCAVPRRGATRASTRCHRRAAHAPRRGLAGRHRRRRATRAWARRRSDRAEDRSSRGSRLPWPLLERLAQLEAGAPVLPAHHRGDGLPGRAPRGRRTRSGSRYRSLRPGIPTSATTSATASSAPGQQLAGIVLDHARRRAPGRHRTDGGAAFAQPGVERNAARARAALVEREDDVGGHLARLSGRRAGVRDARRADDRPTSR